MMDLKFSGRDIYAPTPMVLLGNGAWVMMGMGVPYDRIADRRRI
jgi:hypothetical protein